MCACVLGADFPHCDTDKVLCITTNEFRATTIKGVALRVVDSCAECHTFNTVDLICPFIKLYQFFFLGD